MPCRALTVVYAEQIAARRTSGDLVAVTVNVNDLGAVNEVYGTGQGDRILKLSRAESPNSSVPTTSSAAWRAMSS